MVFLTRNSVTKCLPGAVCDKVLTRVQYENVLTIELCDKMLMKLLIEVYNVDQTTISGPMSGPASAL